MIVFHLSFFYCLNISEGINLLDYPIPILLASFLKLPNYIQLYKAATEACSFKFNSYKPDFILARISKHKSFSLISSFLILSFYSK